MAGIFLPQLPMAGPQSVFRGEGETGRLAGNESWESGGRLTPQERLGFQREGPVGFRTRSLGVKEEKRAENGQTWAQVAKDTEAELGAPEACLGRRG